MTFYIRQTWVRYQSETQSKTNNLSEARKGHQCIAQMLELYPCVFRNPPFLSTRPALLCKGKGNYHNAEVQLEGKQS